MNSFLVRSNAFDTCDEWNESFISEASTFIVALCSKGDDNIILYDIDEDDPDKLQPGAIAGVAIIVIIIIIIAILRRKIRTSSVSYSISS